MSLKDETSKSCFPLVKPANQHSERLSDAEIRSLSNKQAYGELTQLQSIDWLAPPPPITSLGIA